MANTFKAINFAAEPASAGTPYVMYTAAGSTTTVVLGFVLANIHTTAVPAEVELVSDTANRGGANDVANGKVPVSPVPIKVPVAAGKVETLELPAE